MTDNYSCSVCLSVKKLFSIVFICLKKLVTLSSWKDNAEWRVNAECRMQNAECRMLYQCKMQNAECRMAIEAGWSRSALKIEGGSLIAYRALHDSCCSLPRAEGLLKIEMKINSDRYGIL